jgi:hypothetical protein
MAPCFVALGEVHGEARPGVGLAKFRVMSMPGALPGALKNEDGLMGRWWARTRFAAVARKPNDLSRQRIASEQASAEHRGLVYGAVVEVQHQGAVLGETVPRGAQARAEPLEVGVERVEPVVVRGDAGRALSLTDARRKDDTDRKRRVEVGEARTAIEVMCREEPRRVGGVTVTENDARLAQRFAPRASGTANSRASASTSTVGVWFGSRA